MRCGESLVSALCRYVSAQARVDQTSVSASCPSNDALTRENERLRKELQVYVQKAARLQKVSKIAPNRGETIRSSSTWFSCTLRLSSDAPSRLQKSMQPLGSDFLGPPKRFFVN